MSDEHVSTREAETTDVTLLDPRHARFVHMYLTGQYTQAELANLFDVHINTIKFWIKKPDIQAVIKEYQFAEHEMVETALKSLKMKAVDKLSHLIDSPIDGVALQAVKDVLDRGGHKSKQEIKIDKKVTTYEEKLNGVIESTIIDVDDFEEVE